MKIINYRIKKPMAWARNRGIYVRINEDVLKRAIKQKAWLRVWKGGVIDPVKWLKEGDYREQVFLRPGQPMKMRGGYVPVKDENQANLFAPPKTEEEILKENAIRLQL